MKGWPVLLARGSEGSKGQAPGVLLKSPPAFPLARPETFPRRTPLSAPLPHPAVRVQATLHGAPPCYGPLPRDCRGASSAPPARGCWEARGRGNGAKRAFIFPIRLSLHATRTERSTPVEPQEYDEIIRHLVTIAEHQRQINEDQRAFNRQQVEINQRLEITQARLEITQARIETLLTRMLWQDEDGRDA